MTDYYNILDVGRSATSKEIRKAYLRQCKRWHPDKIDAKKDPDGWARANARIQLINDAHKVLKEPVSRRQYDERWELERGVAKKKATTPAPPRVNPAGVTPQYVRSRQPYNNLNRRADLSVAEYLRSFKRRRGGFWRNYFSSLTLDNKVALGLMLLMFLYVMFKLLLG